MAAPSVTYTFTNGTTADATQVNTNFTDLINGASDGTKDYTINALVVGGSATFNGAVTLGNASGDAITVTGSLSSSVPVSTNASYDIGGSTTGLAGLYLGNNTRTVRLVAGTLTGTYTITLPVATAAVGQLMVFNASSTAEFRYADKFTASKTGAYTATGDETIIPCDASSGAFTVTLPAASTMTGKQLKIIKTDSTFNAVTIDGNSSETIDGATTTTLNTQYECLTIACDGSNWHIVQRKIPSKWTSYTPTFGAGFGTVNTHEFYWKRVGDSIQIVGSFTSGTVAASAASFSLPSGLTSATTTSTKLAGFGGRQANATPIWSILNAGNTATLTLSAFSLAGIDPFTGQNGNTIASTSNIVFLDTILIQVTGWNG